MACITGCKSTHTFRLMKARQDKLNAWCNWRQGNFLLKQWRPNEVHSGRAWSLRLRVSSGKNSEIRYFVKELGGGHCPRPTLSTPLQRKNTSNLSSPATRKAYSRCQYCISPNLKRSMANLFTISYNKLKLPISLTDSWTYTLTNQTVYAFHCMR